MIEFASFIIFIFMFVVISFDNIFLRIKQRSNNMQLLQVGIERNVLAAKILDFEEEKLEPVDSGSEGFIKFISDSRDWAFDYIENVQDGINKFIIDAGPSIEYWEEYGAVMDTPLDVGMRQISLSYKELKSLLPDDYGKIDT